jgi:hypothetical protein
MAYADFITPLPMTWNPKDPSSVTGRFPANLENAELEGP